MNTKKLTYRREFVRLVRLNGWAKGAIIRESSHRCYVVMLESKAFGSFAEARKHLKESIIPPEAA